MPNCRPATTEELAKIRTLAQQADYYSILGFKLKFWSSEMQISALFRNIYRQFLLPQPVPTDYEFFLLGGDDRNSLLLANDLAYPLYRTHLFPDQVHTLIFNTLAYQLTEHFLFHSAAVSRENQGIIIVGASGSGKTTLALKMVQEGYEFLSDEFTPIHCHGLKLYSFPRSLGLRRGTLKLFPNLKAQPLRHNPGVAQGVAQNEDCFLDAAYLSPRTEPCPLKTIYFLSPEPSINKKYYLIDMALYRENHKLAATLNALSEMTLVEQREEHGLSVYRFQIERAARSLTNFLYTCNLFKESILYYEKVPEEEPDFSQEREFVPLDKSTAALELLKHLHNRSRHSLLRRKFRRLSHLLLEMGRIVDRVECWQIRYKGK